MDSKLSKTLISLKTDESELKKTNKKLLSKIKTSPIKVTKKTIEKIQKEFNIDNKITVKSPKLLKEKFVELLTYIVNKPVYSVLKTFVLLVGIEKIANTIRYVINPHEEIRKMIELNKIK